MLKIVCLLFFPLLLTGMVYAQTLEDIEGHFQKGLQYSQGGMNDEAIKEFNEVVAADPVNLPKDYYVQTYAEAFFDIGMLYGKNGDNQKAAENFKKSLEIMPDHKRALYYLSYVFLNLGEVAKAKSFYGRAKLLGFTGDDPQNGDMVGTYFNSVKKRTLTIQYPLFFESGKSIPVTIEGNLGGDEELVRDTLTAIEKYSKVVNFSGSFQKILVETVRVKENNTIIVEKWTVGDSGSQKDFWVRYNFAPPKDFPYKVMVNVSEKDYE